MRVRIEPKTGPAQGVQITPRTRPKKKPPRLPLFDCPTWLALLINPFILVVNISNGLGQIINIANTARRTIATFRKELGDRPKLSTNTESKKLARAKLKTKPRTINNGLVLLCWPTELPNMIGKSGSMHGAAIVRIPASSANKICIICFLK
jgi:hypothetical protein